MSREIKLSNTARMIIKIIVCLAFAGLLISIATDLFVGRLELVFCFIATVGSYILFLSKKKRMPKKYKV
ncbi:MAG: hypothetical protein K0S41_1184 [Anaerocolumna sp.]|jgi:hypothetical protein|nr:hypothetical protein [Anaerocolumna sp.]